MPAWHLNSHRTQPLSGPVSKKHNHRFPRAARLTAAQDFSRVFRQCSRSADRYFTVLAHYREGGEARLGLAVARKSARSAVARNRIKRIVRESFRHGSGALGSADIVVISRPPAAAASNRILMESLEAHWRRLARRHRAQDQ